MYVQPKENQDKGRHDRFFKVITGKSIGQGPTGCTVAVQRDTQTQNKSGGWISLRTMSYILELGSLSDP